MPTQSGPGIGAVAQVRHRCQTCATAQAACALMRRADAEGAAVKRPRQASSCQERSLLETSLAIGQPCAQPLALYQRVGVPWRGTEVRAVDDGWRGTACSVLTVRRPRGRRPCFAARLIAILLEGCLDALKARSCRARRKSLRLPLRTSSAANVGGGKDSDKRQRRAI